LTIDDFCRQARRNRQSLIVNRHYALT